MNPNVKSPCKDCSDREVGCHGKCDKYKAFQQECAESAKRRNEYWLEHQATKRYDGRSNKWGKSKVYKGQR